MGTKIGQSSSKEVINEVSKTTEIPLPKGEGAKIEVDVPIGGGVNPDSGRIIARETVPLENKQVRLKEVVITSRGEAYYNTYTCNQALTLCETKISMAYQHPVSAEKMKRAKDIIIKDSNK